jgi:hypothetical protein
MSTLKKFSDKRLKQIVITGVLTILVSYTLVTYVGSLFAFVSPSKELRWDGNIDYINKPSFTAGENVMIQGLLLQGETYFEQGQYYSFSYSENIRWILVVMDPNHLPIYFESNPVVNAQGDVSIGSINFTIPNNAATGTYDVRLMVWTDWLPGGETRTNTINEITFEVTS